MARVGRRLFRYKSQPKKHTIDLWKTPFRLRHGLGQKWKTDLNTTNDYQSKTASDLNYSNVRIKYLDKIQHVLDYIKNLKKVMEENLFSISTSSREKIPCHYRHWLVLSLPPNVACRIFRMFK